MLAGYACSVAAPAQTAHFSYAQSIVANATSLNQPYSMAVDGNGNVYVADTLNNVVRKFVTSTSGGYTQTSDVAIGLNSPMGVAVDGNGSIYVADTLNNAVHKYVPNSSGGYTQQSDVANGLNEPKGLAVDGSGTVYIADWGNNAVHRYALNGSGGYTQKSDVASGLNHPYGVALDSNGNVYVTDTFAGEVHKYAPDSTGAYIKQNDVANLPNRLYGVGVDRAGDVYIADPYNNAVHKYAPDGSGGYTKQDDIGNGLNEPFGLAIDEKGDLFIADTFNSRVLRVQFGGTSFGTAQVTSTPSPGSVQSLTFTFDSAGTLGAPLKVLTQGAANLDFKDAGTGTCTTNGAGFFYNAGSSCTADVTFTPTLSNIRYGAVVLSDSTGAPIATGYIFGTGLAPQLTFSPSTESVVASSLYGPEGVAVDSNHNVYIADTFNNKVVKVPWTGSNYGPQSTLGSGLSYPTGVAVDGAGNVYIADTFNNRVLEVPWTGRNYGTQSTLGSGLSGPEGVAVDGSRNVYITDAGTNSVHKFAPDGSGGYTQQSDVADGLKQPYGVAVDSGGNVYISDAGSNSIHKFAPDGSGGYTQQSDVGSGLSQPGGMAVDGSNNLYIADYGNNRVTEEDYEDTPSLSFATPTPAGSEDTVDGPKTVTISNVGNESLIFDIPASGVNPGFPANFPENMSDSNACISGIVLAPGSSCDIATEFKPTGPGSNTGGVILRNNNLNIAGATQTIPLSGIGASPITLSPSSTTLPAGTVGVAYTQTFTASGGTSSLYKYSLSGAPSGLNINPNTGTVAGTPTQTGTFSFSVTATDGNNFSAAQTYTLAVNQATASVIFGNLNQTFTGSPLSVTATTTPANLPVSVTYNSSKTAPTTAGSYTVVATITDANYQGSATGTLIIGKAKPVIAWSTPAAITYGTPLGATQLNATATYNGTVVAGTFTYSPTIGTILHAGANQTLSVAFAPTDSNDFIAPAPVTTAVSVAQAPLTLTANNAARVYGTVNPPFTGTITGTMNGDVLTESFSTAATLSSNAGTYPIVPGVTGTNLSNYSINATDGTLSVRPAGTTTALSVSSTSINPGTSVTLSAQVASVTTGMPTGTVAFYDGATLLGTALLVNGSASYSTASLVAGGTHTVSATYSGDTNLMGSTSASSVGIVVSSLDFTFSTSGPVIQTVTRAATTTFSYSIAPTAGTYPGMVSFTVSGLPSGAEYSLSPSTIAANAGKQTLTLTVTVPGILTSFRRESTSLWQRCGETTLSLGILLPLVTLRKKRRLWQDAGKRALLVFAVLAGVAAAIGLSGCGADSSLVKQGPQSYAVTMTATCGAVQHSSTVTLNVQ